MRILRRAMLLIVTLCTLSFSAFGHDFSLLTEPHELKMALSHQDARFIDLRSEKEYNKMHIPGFENMPFQEEAVLTLAEETKPLYLICSAGQRSAMAYNLLLEAGATEVHACIFGVSEYAEEIGETFMEGANICIPCLLLIEKEENP